MERREFLRQAAAAGAAATLAGCLLEEQTFESAPARISMSGTQEAGYTEESVEQSETKREVGVRGRKRTITVRGWNSSYRKASVGDSRVSEVLLVSSPNPTVAGRSFNPLLQGSTEDLLKRYAKQNENISVERKLGERESSVLGENRTFETFELTATQNNVEIPVEAQVTRFSHEDDALLVFALYPMELSDVERPIVFDMLEGVVHPADLPT